MQALRFKGSIPLCSKLFLYRTRMSDSARSSGHVRHVLLKKEYCVACKKSALKVKINLSFVNYIQISYRQISYCITADKYLIISEKYIFLLGTSLARLTRALLGGCLNAPPPSGFSRLAKIRRRAAPPGFHPPYPHPIFYATFVKISIQCHVRSGHQVRSSDPTTK